MGYWVYLARCGDNTIYTGATTDLMRRLKEHNRGSSRGKGAKYTASHLPVRLAQAWEVGTWSEALRLEYALKRCPRIKKDQMIKLPELIYRLAERRGFDFSIHAVSQELVNLID